MTAIAVTLALAADLLTADVSREINPLALAIITAGYGFAAKTALCALVIAVIAICRPQHRVLALGVAAAAVAAGGFGAWSNL